MIYVLDQDKIKLANEKQNDVSHQQSISNQIAIQKTHGTRVYTD